MGKISKLLFGLLFTSLICGCTASRVFRPRQINVQGDFLHKTTNISFPINWERFKRESITVFNKDSTNVGVSYLFNNPNQDIKFTIYIYPTENGIEHRIRDEYFNCLQAIATVSNQLINTTPKHVRVSKDGYKVLGLSGVISNENLRTVLVLFECGKYFLKYRISSNNIDTSVLSDVSNKLIGKFSPIDIVKKQPLIQGSTINISPGITTDSSCLEAILAAVFAKSKWVYENVDSLEKCSGFPSLYFEEQRVTVDTMLNRWGKLKHNKTRFDKFFDDLTDIRNSGFLNEFICDQYEGTLLLPDNIKLDLENYEIWKRRTNPTVRLVGQYYYLIGYENSYKNNK